MIFSVKNMLSKHSIPPCSRLTCVIIINLIIVIALILGTRDINFWPTDSYNPYIPTAARLFELPYISSMHDLPADDLNQLNMRGKEALILGIAVMQKILNDPQSLFPNVLLLIIATGVSSVTIYIILHKLFSEKTATVSFILWITCFWQYMYILQGAHQPLVLMNFLLSFLFARDAYTEFNIARPNQAKKIAYALLSGFFLGMMVFSSPTSVIYTPYFLLVILLSPANTNLNTKTFKKLTILLPIWLLGTALVFLVFLLPEPVENFNKFVSFILTSQKGNHFTHYREYLSQYFTYYPNFRGQGWSWVGKYFLTVMPVMFPAFIIAIAYLLVKSFNQKSIIFVILICLSTPLAVETAQVAQFGRNYFSTMFGIIIAISAALDHLFTGLHKSNRAILGTAESAVDFAKSCEPTKLAKMKNISLISIIVLHILFNANAFFTDVYPTRMATAKIYHWLRDHKINEILAIQKHPRNLFTIDVLNNPRQSEKIKIYGIDNLKQPITGKILLPPITGNVIWNDCSSEDFNEDPFLNEIYRSGNLPKFVVKSFKSMASSKYWRQEEEVCTYRDLILNDHKNIARDKTMIHILDAEKLQKEWFAKNRQ